jgi:DNA-binding transcriptional MerR regulator
VGIAPLRVRNAGGLRVSDAARRVGVAVTALRYWEQRGLLRPQRDRSSRYRRYDERQLRRLQVIVLLREAGYGVAAIAPVLEDLVAGRPERILEAVAQRRRAIAGASRACAEATAALWAYMQLTGRADPNVNDASASA